MLSAEQGRLLVCFMERIQEDSRISPAHISLYVALVCAASRGLTLLVFRTEMAPRCKIAGPGTYHRCIRDLHEFGYLRYYPSYNHFVGSLVELEV